MRAAVVMAAMLVWGGAASAQEAAAPTSKPSRAAASEWRVVECPRGAEAKRAVPRQFGHGAGALPSLANRSDPLDKLCRWREK